MARIFCHKVRSMFNSNAQYPMSYFFGDLKHSTIIPSVSGYQTMHASTNNQQQLEEGHTCGAELKCILSSNFMPVAH